jgi:hypothetical protein
MAPDLEEGRSPERKVRLPGRELIGGEVPERAVRPRLIVFTSPHACEGLGLAEVGEALGVQ